MRKIISILILLNSIFLFAQNENLIKFENKERLNGYMNDNNEVIIKPIYKNASVFNKGLALVSTDGGWTIINNKGQQLVKFGGIPGPIYSDLDYELIRHQLKGKWGFINRKGEIVIDYKYKDTKDFSEGLAPIKVRGKWGFIDEKNNIIIKPIFDNVNLFHNEVAGFELKGKWGFINKKGEIIIDAKYTSVYDFSEELCAVNNFDYDMANGSWASEVIDKKGNVIFKGEFYNFNQYKNGIANYWEGYHFTGKNVFINRIGEIIKKE